MNKTTTKAEKIENRVTLEIAEEWDKEQEQTLLFDGWMDAWNIDVSLTNRPDEFDRLQDVFEGKCQKLLNLERRYVAACMACGGWTRHGGMSHHHDSNVGCQCRGK